MAPLRGLEKEYPLIGADFQRRCAIERDCFAFECARPVGDFLIHDLHSLLAKAEHRPCPERFRQEISQVLCIVDGLHRPWIKGIALLRGARDCKRVLSTGCEGVNSLLNGGLREGRVTELAGPSSSGKTQVKSRDFQFAMNRILCCAVFDIFSMFSVLQKLESKLKCQIHGSVGIVRVLIIDSISSLIFPILGGSGSQGRALMISAGSLLKKLAYEYNIAVVMINHALGGENGCSKPALGETWKTIPHAFCCWLVMYLSARFVIDV